MAKTWTPDGWKAFGNTNIWKIEDEVKELYSQYYADHAHTLAEGLIIDQLNNRTIDSKECDYLMQFNDARYDDNCNWLQYVETLHD